MLKPVQLNPVRLRNLPGVAPKALVRACGIKEMNVIRGAFSQRTCGLFLHRRTATTPAYCARIHRIGNSPARNGVGRGLAISVPTDSKTRGNGPDGRGLSRRVRRRGAGLR